MARIVHLVEWKQAILKSNYFSGLWYSIQQQQNNEQTWIFLSSVTIRIWLKASLNNTSTMSDSCLGNLPTGSVKNGSHRRTRKSNPDHFKTKCLSISIGGISMSIRQIKKQNRTTRQNQSKFGWIRNAMNTACVAIQSTLTESFHVWHIHLSVHSRAQQPHCRMKIYLKNYI